VYVLNSPCNHTDPAGTCIGTLFYAEELVSIALGLLGIPEAKWLEHDAFVEIAVDVQAQIVPELGYYLAKRDSAALTQFLADQFLFTILPKAAQKLFTNPLSYLGAAAQWLSGSAAGQLLLLAAQTAFDFGTEYYLRGGFCGSSGSPPSSTDTSVAIPSPPPHQRIIYSRSDRDMPAVRPGVIAGV